MLRQMQEPAMKIDVLYFRGCPNHEPTVQRVRDVVDRLGVEAEIDEIEVSREDDPAALRFLGSPTVLVDGVDIDPAQREGVIYGFGCRTYGGAGAPSEAMVEAAIREAAGGDTGRGEAHGPAAGASDGGTSSGPTADGSTFWASAAAIGTAGLASACCWLPLLAVGLGLSLSIGGLIGAFEAARPYLLGVAAVCLAVGFYAVYFRRHRCAPGAACATTRPKPGAASQAAVWSAAATVVALALFPYYSGVLINSESVSASGSEAAVERAGVPSSADAMVFEIDGMTCAGCEAAVCAALRELPGVEACRASHEEGRAWISSASEQPEEAAILDAIERAGFSGSLAPTNARNSNDH
jgi:copper chaperone CopZ